MIPDLKALDYLKSLDFNVVTRAAMGIHCRAYAERTMTPGLSSAADPAATPRNTPSFSAAFSAGPEVSTIVFAPSPFAIRAALPSRSSGTPGGKLPPNDRCVFDLKAARVAKLRELAVTTATRSAPVELPIASDFVAAKNEQLIEMLRD